MSSSRMKSLRLAALASLALSALCIALWSDPVAQQEARPQAAAGVDALALEPELRACRAPLCLRGEVEALRPAAEPVYVGLAAAEAVPTAIERAPPESATIRPVEAADLPPEVRARLSARLSGALAQRPRPQPLPQLDRDAPATGLVRPLGEERVIDTPAPRWAAPAELERKLEEARVP